MSRNKSIATPWDALIAEKIGATLEGTALPSRKFLAGEPLRERTPAIHDRADYSRAFIRQLEVALQQRARELDALWEASVITDELAARIAALFQRTCKGLDRTLQHKKEGAPPTLRDAEQLLIDVGAFEHAADRLLRFEDKEELALAFCLRDLCDDIAHYATQIRMTYAIVAVQDDQPKLANRPTNWAAKDKFAEFVQSHQAQHGAGSFPKPRNVMAELQKCGYDVPARTLRDWKNQFKDGTVFAYVQDRKRQ